MEQHDAICEDGGIACLPFGEPVGTQFSGSLTVELAGNLSEWHSAMRGWGIGAYFGEPVSTSFSCSLMVGPVGCGVAWCCAKGRSIAHFLVSPLRW